MTSIDIRQYMEPEDLEHLKGAFQREMGRDADETEEGLLAACVYYQSVEDRSEFIAKLFSEAYQQGLSKAAQPSKPGF